MSFLFPPPKKKSAGRKQKDKTETSNFPHPSSWGTSAIFPQWRRKKKKETCSFVIECRRRRCCLHWGRRGDSCCWRKKMKKKGGKKHTELRRSTVLSQLFFFSRYVRNAYNFSSLLCCPAFLFSISGAWIYRATLFNTVKKTRNHSRNVGDWRACLFRFLGQTESERSVRRHEKWKKNPFADMSSQRKHYYYYYYHCYYYIELLLSWR